MAIVHLSAYRMSPEWPVAKERIASALGGSPLDKPTFKTWISITEALGGRYLQSRMQGDENRLSAPNLYRTTDVATLKLLGSTEVLRILDAALGERNAIHHGGALTGEDAKSRLEQLESLLVGLRKEVGRTFRRYELVEAFGAETEDEKAFVTHVRYVMGANPSLREGKATFNEFPIKRRLYMHSVGEHRALKLVPLIQMREAPPSASFYYGGLERSEQRGEKRDLARWVCYHLVSDDPGSSDMSQKVETDVLDLLADLRRQPPAR
jgi:hypothetical protein